MGIKFSSFSIRGIDVSQFNGTIDWTKPGCNFAGIRVGYGRVLDTKFTTNWQNAKGKVNRIPYWYLDYYSNHNAGSSANGITDDEWGVIQANTCWANLKDDSEGIVFLDIENGNSSFAPAISTVAARVQTIAKSFLQQMDSLSGKTNGIYCSMGLLTWFGSWFKDRPLWVAWYNEKQTLSTVTKAVTNANWTGKCLIWQYASDGDIDDDGRGDGVSLGMQYSSLDLNAWAGSEADYTSLFSASSPADPTDDTGEDENENDALYAIRVIVSNLNIRSGPGTTYPRLRKATYHDEYNIYEEQNGFGRISATEAVWLCLSTQYVTKLESILTEEEEAQGEAAIYRINILINNLNVRSGPGTLYPRLRRADFPGEYDIFEEKNGFGRISNTKSEWVSLNTQYVQRLTSTKSAPAELSDAEKLARLWAAHPELH